MKVDWGTIAELATAGGTLVLAISTFASVRSANRAARAAERSLLVGLQPLLDGGHRWPGAAARIDDARVDPHLEGVIGMETRAAPPDDLPRRGPLHTKRDEQQGQRRSQAAHDDGHPAQTQEVTPARSHGCLLTAFHPGSRHRPAVGPNCPGCYLAWHGPRGEDVYHPGQVP